MQYKKACIGVKREHFTESSRMRKVKEMYLLSLMYNTDRKIPSFKKAVVKVVKLSVLRHFLRLPNSFAVR